ncbi:MAG TPA: hypothetical protein VKV15_04080 [Bryobacteraceae bacterium]|nr:hypothetical protein [Bryobacteraceae bacterium]
MKKQRRCILAAAIAGTLLTLRPAFPAVDTSPSPATAQLVITVQSAHGGTPANLHREDLMVLENGARVPITGLQKLTGDQAGMQLFVLLDDSTRSSSLSIHLPELKAFVNSLPATTQVAIGYMRNGGFSLDQGFTTHHEQAANALRLPESIPGTNGSPYFALSYLVNHWPSKQQTGRRAVLMLTDGVDRYYTSSPVDDPYVDAAIGDAQKKNVIVYSIYLRGAGLYPGTTWGVTLAQCRLRQVSQQTGGYAYFEGLISPVAISPFLKDLDERLDNQYKVTFEARNTHGPQRVTLRTELPGLKIDAQQRIYL